MGASESKLSFRKGVFRLFEEMNIKEDNEYWYQFWELPEAADDVFSLIPVSDVRRIRDFCMGNLEILCLAVISRIFSISCDPEFPEPTLSLHLLNCIRIATRLLPFIYEKPSLDDWYERFFWKLESTVDNEGNPLTKPIGEKLFDTLFELLFRPGFTVQQDIDMIEGDFFVWEAGVGCTQAAFASQSHEINRMEVLRLILMLLAKPIYKEPSQLMKYNDSALGYVTSCADTKTVLPVLCSLLNTILVYNPPGWGLSYDKLVSADVKECYVQYCRCVLIVLLASDNGSSVNYYSHYLSKVHKSKEFNFITMNMMRWLHKPFQQVPTMILKKAYLDNSLQTLLLLFELVKCNKRYRKYLYETMHILDLVVILICYTVKSSKDVAKHLLCTKVALSILQLLSVDSTFGAKLNSRFEDHKSLPLNMKIPAFAGSYGEFLILSLLKIFNPSVSNALNSLQVSALSIMLNISPYLQNISRMTASKLVFNVTLLANPVFLNKGALNASLLVYFIEALNGLLLTGNKVNSQLFIEVLRAQSIFIKLKELDYNEFIELTTKISHEHEVSLAGSQNEIPESDATKSTGKLREVDASDSSSTILLSQSSFLKWKESLPLHCISSIIASLGEAYNQWNKTDFEFMQSKIAELELNAEMFPPICMLPLDFNSEFKVWHESIIWSTIYTIEMAPTKGHIGMWNSSNVKLFQVQASAINGPTISDPRGAVDAVAASIVTKIGQLSLRGSSKE